MKTCKLCGQELPEKQKIKWQKIGDLEWSENLGEMTWDEANKKCEELGGRLPTRIELIDLVDNHSEEIKDWEDGSHCFWSATTISYSTHYAWNVYLGTGGTNDTLKTNTYDSRCCRNVR